MIAILQVRAYGDFDAPYDINIAAGDPQRAYSICRVLNTFCRQLPGYNQDIKLSKYLEDEECAEKLAHQLVAKKMFSTQQAGEFVERLNGLCKGHYVYVSANPFAVSKVTQI